MRSAKMTSNGEQNSAAELDHSQHSTPTLRRCYCLDSSLLQRPPSGESIRSIVRSQGFRPETSNADESVIPEETADEADNQTTPLVVFQNEFSASCIECVKPYPALERGDISPGDHIIYSGAIYDHHAIVVKLNTDQDLPSNVVKLTLIHATNTTFGASAGLTKLVGGKANIRETEETLDLKTTKTMVVKYSVMSFSPKEIIERARNLKRNNTFEYHLFQNNCEHFATFCVTGERLSVQVGKFKMTMRMFMSRGFQGLSDMKERNKVAHEHNLICKTCYERNVKLLSVERSKIRQQEDVNVGDIITYTYYVLHHDAVVFEKKEATKANEIKLTIAHYAFCGFATHRTIVQEDITIPTDGSVTVIQYKAPDFAIYSPEETVRRDKKRIGEQLFAFFANDSSHFARWCKLKLTHDQVSVASDTDHGTPV